MLGSQGLLGVQTYSWLNFGFSYCQLGGTLWLQNRAGQVQEGSSLFEISCPPPLSLLSIIPVF